MSAPERNRDPKWDKGVAEAPDFSCGRLDGSSYTVDGVMFRNVYVMHGGKENIAGWPVHQLVGPFCDEVAYAAMVGQALIRGESWNLTADNPPPEDDRLIEAWTAEHWQTGEPEATIIKAKLLETSGNTNNWTHWRYFQGPDA